MEKLPEIKFKKNKVNITDFGGVGDGLQSNTHAFALAIDSLSKKGGGTLIVPEGLWITGPIVFKSNIHLQVEKGALILFSPNKDEYPIIETSFEGFDTHRCQSPISGKNLSNIAITGEGVIDGNGDVWRAVKKNKLTSSQWKKLIKSGGLINEKGDQWYPSESYKLGTQNIIDQNIPNIKDQKEWEKIKDFLRPVMLNFTNCKNIVLDGVTFQNSPAWCLHPLMCTNVRISNVTVRNPWYSQNGDGLDLESCKNAVVYNCSFDVGDDAICIKSGKDEDGRRRGIPCENVLVRNCVVYHGHGGFVVGSEMSGGVRNIDVQNCLFMGTDVGLRFKSTRGRGGVVENIFIRDINMINIPTDPILFNLFYGGKSALESASTTSEKKETQPISVSETTPSFRNIYIKNISCNGAKRAMFFNGLPEMNVKNISLENINIHSNTGAEIKETTGIYMRNVNLSIKKGPLLKLSNVKNVELDAVHSNYPEQDTILIKGTSKENIRVKNMIAKQVTE